MTESDRYKAFRRFNTSPPSLDAHSRVRPVGDPRLLFGGNTMEERLAVALVEARAVPFKELLESFEVFARIRGAVRRPVVADLCAGHGLTGVLFGAFERDVHEVILVDRRRTASAAVVVEAVGRVAPWLPAKVRYAEGRLEDAELPDGAGIIGVHACGSATDAVISRALELGGPVGLLPCCHSKAGCEAPVALRAALGLETATDVHRTYRLEAAGYRVRWSAIPAAITPMNRVITGTPS